VISMVGVRHAPNVVALTGPRRGKKFSNALVHERNKVARVLE
jgi:hypothetical protein